MWCHTCRQDVPCAPAAEGGLCCPQCGTRASHDSAAPPKPAPDASPSADDRPWLDDWEAKAELRDIERALGLEDERDTRSAPALRRETARFDSAHGQPVGWHVGKPAGRRSAEPQNEGGGQVLSWTALSLGTMAFVCGGVLVGWSFYASRPELWNFGLPIALAGQIALVVGLILQIERLWRDNRRSADRLETVDAQLNELAQSAQQVGRSFSSPSATFYTHFAHGASTELLLTDLKSQLDMLAEKVSQQE